MYRVCFAFPIASVVNKLSEKIPPWSEHREMDVIKAIIKFWLHNDLYICLPETDDYRLMEKWTELANEFSIANELYDIVNGPTHPAWNPAFDSIPDKLIITRRSMFITYSIPESH